MYGHTSEPTKLFSFGADEPTENLEVVREQMRLAHKYRNVLVEIERARRIRVDGALRGLSPDLVECETEIAREEEALGKAREAVNRAKAAARANVRPAEAVAEARRARGRLRDLRARRKELRAALFSSPEWVSAQEKIDTDDLVARKKARSESGLYWSTYLIVEQSMGKARRGAPPKFMRWRGDGHLAVQLQQGLAVKDAWGGEDARLRIDALPNVGSHGAQKRTVVRFRVQSTGKGEPVWATVPVTIHRALPPDATIKWAHLIRRRVGTHDEWRVQFALARTAGWPREDAVKEGEVGIDIGWRIMEDGRLRVAYWCGSDGAEGELALPSRWVERMKHHEKIRSVRGSLFNAAKATLAAWLRTVGAGVPEWMRETVVTLAQWRSEARLAALVLRWRGERFAGDDASPVDPALANALESCGTQEADKAKTQDASDRHWRLAERYFTASRAGIFDQLECWRWRDRHLYDYEANERMQLLREREDSYRVFAAEMRRRYAVAWLEGKAVRVSGLMDLRDFHVLPKPEEAPMDGALREHTRDAALSILRRCLVESMRETKAREAANTTLACHACGVVRVIAPGDRGELFLSCVCGKKVDQDRNAALNLLRGMTASAGVPQAP